MKILYSCNKVTVQYLRESDVLFIKYLLLIKTEGLVLFLLEKMCEVCVCLCVPTIFFSVAEWCTVFTYLFHPQSTTLSYVTFCIRMNRRDQTRRLNHEGWDRQGLYHEIGNKKYLQHCSRNMSVEERFFVLGYDTL